VLDKITALLADKHMYPRLKHVVVTGHSAGGQTVQRYALVTGSDTSSVCTVAANSGGPGGDHPAPLASRFHRVSTHFLLNLHGI
jgi:poly(3-hydroxybutyrate) depolymerase